ncbi:MAG: orotate phosphoribosyltransferase [Thermoprotei archaeon]|nr:MAG: orotate phosphoribosyltransferase [Thermoprotei archaeon]RLE99229.1 MAG: orotate phosphoribosyltransferase [Thermoprotei archaeon]
MIGELAQILYKVGCIKVGEFRLTSGALSPIYVDLKILPSFPEEFRRVIRLAVRRLREKDFHAICGLAVGGIPLATAIAYEMGKPLVYIRKERKGHGTERLLEGHVEEGSKIMLVDDVSTTGGTLARGVKVLRDCGFEIEEAFVIVDREQGARETLGKLEVNLDYLASLSQIVDYLFFTGLMPRSYYNKIMSYLREVRASV